MNASALVPVVVAAIGGGLYVVAQGKASELGRLMFLAGLLALCLVLAEGHVRVSVP